LGAEERKIEQGTERSKLRRMGGPLTKTRKTDGRELSRQGEHPSRDSEGGHAREVRRRNQAWRAARSAKSLGFACVNGNERKSITKRRRRYPWRYQKKGLERAVRGAGKKRRVVGYPSTYGKNFKVLGGALVRYARRSGNKNEEIEWSREEKRVRPSRRKLHPRVRRRGPRRGGGGKFIISK